jgi:hypothetical protein
MPCTARQEGKRHPAGTDAKFQKGSQGRQVGQPLDHRVIDGRGMLLV